MNTPQKKKLSKLLTDAVNEQAGQNQVKNVEKRPAFHFDDVGDIRVRFRAARIVFFVIDRLEIDQIKLAIGLIIGYVTQFHLLHQIDLQIPDRSECNSPTPKALHLY